MIFNVSVVYFLPIDDSQIKRGSDIWYTDSHAVVAEPSAWQFGDAVHDFTGNLVGIISEEMVDESCFITSQCGLTDLTQK